MKRPLRIVAGTLTFLFFLFAAERAAHHEAHAHLIRLPDSPSQSVLENRAASQAENLKHSRYVARNGAGRNQVWHRKATVWIERELAETRRALRPPAPVISGMWYEIAVCETGRRPPLWHINTGNGFYGGLQFLTSTWLAYGGGKYAPRADLASPTHQVRVASGMGLSHWPVCGAPYR
jgi:hypothetical protein